MSPIALNGGTINYISMQRRLTANLPKPYSDCDIDNTQSTHYDSPYFNLVLNSSYQYSQEMCVLQCYQAQAIRLCNCTIPILISLYNVSCKNDAESKCAMMTLYTGDLNSAVHSCLSQCPLECNSSEFSLSLTSQTISGIGFANFVHQTPTFLSDFDSTPVNVQTASNKFVQLFAYYDTLTYFKSVDTPSMDIVGFLGSVGGTLGLFLGISVFSLCELIHVLVECCLLGKQRF